MLWYVLWVCLEKEELQLEALILCIIMYIFQIKIKWPFNNHDFQNIEFFSLMSITTPNFDQGNLRLVQSL